MENLINLEILETNKELFKSRIFTDIQFNVLKKKLQNKNLNNNEKTYYYKFIKPKIKAMMILFDVKNTLINGKEHMLEERINSALNIIKKLEKKHKNQKIMLSGSFLFNKKYNDIDAFIFTKYNKEDYRKGKIHVNFLPESSLNSLFFCSLSQISISNFTYNINTNFNIEINEIIQKYELLINSSLNKEIDNKLLRDFILETEYLSKNIILNPQQLFSLNNRISRKNFGILSEILINALVLSQDKKNLTAKLTGQIKEYKKLLLEYKNAENLPIYINTYTKAIELAEQTG